MSSLEDRLRDLGDAVSPPPLPGASAVMQRARQRRHRRRGGLAAVLVVAGAGGAVGANALRSGDEPSVRTAPAGTADAPDPGPTPTTAPATGAPTTAPATGAPTTAPATDGSEVIVMPDVVGLAHDQGRVILEELGFMVESVGDGPANAVVLAQEPAAGARATVGQTVRIEVG